MITFKKLDKNLDDIRPYIKRYGGIFNDLSLGTKFIWSDRMNAEYAIEDDTLIMSESFDGQVSFYYPLGKNAEGAFCKIEEFCRKNGSELSFCCLNVKQAAELSAKYPDGEINSFRDWCDYIYPAQQFLTYSGKHLSGQRNHVNKFKKLYPDYKVNFITENDISRIKEFLKEYESENEFSGWAAEEEQRIYGLIDNFSYLEQFGIFITVGGKIVSASVGERVGETLFVHLEKGLKEYEGVYPLTAQEFAKAFVKDGIKKINREEDCGDMGLRTSKIQYHPSEIKEKFYFTVKSSFFKIAPPVLIATERLTVTDIFKEDKDIYAKLFTDDAVNRYYGYDYREDLGERNPDGEYFFGFMQSLKEKKEEYSLAVRRNGEMIGEIVFYEFSFDGKAEIGFRFFGSEQGKGYAFESVKAAIAYAFARGFNRLTCRHFKENVRSEKLILKLGFVLTGQSETHKFYELKK